MISACRMRVRGFPFRLSKIIKQMSSSPPRDVQQYVQLTNNLYKVGVMRFAADKTATNVYSHFSPSEQQLEADSGYSKGLAEFIEVSGMISQYGLPEEVDQISGAIYMHASVNEDKCSQCLRLAEQEIPRFSINDLKISLECISWWPSEVERSLPVKEMLKSLDAVCIDRLNSLHFTLEDQLRLAHLWQSLIYEPRVEFPRFVLGTLSQYVNQSSSPVLISFLLLLSTLDNSQIELILSPHFSEKFSSDLGQRLIPSIPFLTESEILSAYLGLARLGKSPEREEMKAYLETKFGMRLL